MDTLAAVLTHPLARVRIQVFHLENPGPGEVLIQMEACGLCHSDLMIAGMDKLPLAPLVLGHEGIGRVETVGAGVESLRPGDRVGVTFLASVCGTCEFCRSGRERFCPKQINSGYTRHGALSQFAVAGAAHLARVPKKLAAEKIAPLCCAGWTSYCAVAQTGLAAAQMVGLFGIGGLGHLGLQYARARGLRVAAVDVSEEKLEFARSLGAEIALPASGAGRALTKQCGGVDAAIVFSASPEAALEAFRALRRTGTLVLVGMTAQTLPVPIVEVVLKGVTIRGSYLGSPQDLEEVFRLAAGGVGLPEVEPHLLADVPDLLDRMRVNQLKGRAVVLF